ncbi:MFS transporter [Thalassotalea euphylliae]|uniref:MFS transporter n=1 Tax=Thalassotalea euphylliae TaxID=1655234 RepID=UPI00362FEA92
MHTKVTVNTSKPDLPHSGFIHYLWAATLARVATGGAAVAIVLLAHSFGASGKLIGVYSACLTVPHVLGPIYGKWLDKAKNPFSLIAAACVVFVVSFQLVIQSFHWQLVSITIASLLICGVCTSLMMGGLSSQLRHLVSQDLSIRRRSQSWDIITYSSGLTLGPLLIATISSAYSVPLSVGIVMFVPLLAGFIIWHMPTPHISRAKANDIAGFRQVINIIYSSPALKRTIAMTSSAAFAVAALPVIAIYLVDGWQQNQEKGAYLVTSYGIGYLIGSLILIAKPLKKEALRLLRMTSIALAVSLVIIYFSYSFSTGLVAYCLCGIVNAFFFASSLAARTEYAPTHCAGQVYMWVAAAKITATSIGAFCAGYLVDSATTLPLVISSLVLGIAITLCFWQWQHLPSSTLDKENSR